jgi:hypothetical protein
MTQPTKIKLYANYRHSRTQQKYRVWAFTEMQESNGDWVPGVIYTPVGQTKTTLVLCNHSKANSRPQNETAYDRL